MLGTAAAALLAPLVCIVLYGRSRLCLGKDILHDSSISVVTTQSLQFHGRRIHIPKWKQQDGSTYPDDSSVFNFILDPTYHQ
ncbi:hypothetical protein EDD85DRAFT_261506 [Armillaria nabsnona]|nr:hypothetical protein EDD85DRAFT_261506 [Armillaria nabsnona]